MIDGIHIENFKCFDELRLDLGRLTLLTGYNGTGKSSSIQPLLLLAQALRNEPREAALQLNGPLARLGGAGEIASGRMGGTIRFGVSTREGESASWAFEHDRTLGRNRLRLSGSQFSYDSGDGLRWRPDGPEHDLLRRVRDLVFIGPVRPPFEEAQPYPEDPSALVGDVGFDGRFAAYWFVHQADEDVPAARRHPDDPRVTVRAQVDAWLAEIFPRAHVNAEEIEGRALAKISFMLGRASEWERPANVGYGLSYVFPILVALVCAEPGQILIVDSPEAHLHPRAQSAMGRMLAHFAGAGLQIIVESHSDHLLSGIRLAVRSGRLPSGDAVVHFFGGSGADERMRIAIAGDGSVTDWPAGFFDQAINDLIELS